MDSPAILVLDRLMKAGTIDRAQQDVYVSKYTKIQELLSQALANERVHAQNIGDL
jgi:hypothetical protein